MTPWINKNPKVCNVIALGLGTVNKRLLWFLGVPRLKQSRSTSSTNVDDMLWVSNVICCLWQGLIRDVGDCWAFSGERGRLVLALHQPSVLVRVSLSHIPSSLSVTGAVDSAPRRFLVLVSKGWVGSILSSHTRLKIHWIWIKVVKNLFYGSYWTNSINYGWYVFLLFHYLRNSRSLLLHPLWSELFLILYLASLTFQQHYFEFSIVIFFYLYRVSLVNRL